MLREFWNWSKRHLLLITLVSCVSLFAFAYINIHILHMTSEPEFCAMCHPAQGYGPLAEVDSWKHSAHADAGVSCLDCHGRPGVDGYIMAKMGGLKDLYMQFTITKEHKLEILSNPDADLVPQETCLYCHSDETNKDYRENHPYPIKLVEMRLSDTVVNPEFRQRKGLPDIMTDTAVGGTNFDHALHTEDLELTCNDCHFGVVHREQSKTDRMNMCVECHSDTEDAPQLADCTVCHETQVAMNEGKGAPGLEGEASLMYAEGIDCQSCHTGVDEGLFRPAASSCLDCHEEGYEDVYAEWSKETGEELKKLNGLKEKVEQALIQADEDKRDTSAGWELYAAALTKLNFVKDDGTIGVHNRDYADTILRSAKADLEKIEAQLQNM